MKSIKASEETETIRNTVYVISYILSTVYYVLTSLHLFINVPTENSNTVLPDGGA